MGVMVRCLHTLGHRVHMTYNVMQLSANWILKCKKFHGVKIQILLCWKLCPKSKDINIQTGGQSECCCLHFCWTSGLCHCLSANIISSTGIRMQHFHSRAQKEASHNMIPQLSIGQKWLDGNRVHRSMALSSGAVGL